MSMEHDLLLAAAAQGHVWESLRDILILLSVAMLLGFLAERLRQSAVVGYLLAGTLVGPGALGWVASQETIFGIAELGVALLLFTIGSEFSPRQLLRLGRVPLLAGPLQVVLTTVLAAAAGWLVGLDVREALVIGAMAALSSTACVLRILRDRAEIDSQYGRASLGILLIQDAAVVPLVLIVTAVTEGGTPLAILGRMGLSLALAVALVAAFFVVFNWLIPRVLIMPTWRRNRDLPVLLTVCLAGGAAWSAQALQLSPALGAFVAGMLVAVSPFATQIQADIQPLRAVLVTLFFAAIGMFGDIPWLFGHLGLVLALVAAIVVGKAVLVAVLTKVAGLPWQFAVSTGFCLAQLGEFSFVLATIARENLAGQPVLSETTFRAVVSATILALLITPYLVAAGPRAGSWLEGRLARRRRSASQTSGREPPAAAVDQVTDEATTRPTRESADESPITEAHQAHGSAIADNILIMGFGPAGQRIAEDLLAEHRERLVVVDLNIHNVEVAQRYGLRAYLGDGTQTEILYHAGILRSRVVVITVPNPSAMRQLIEHVRHVAPGVRIVARSRYHIYRWEFLRAGAHAVIDEEDQVGVRMALEVRHALQRDAGETEVG
ncbi:MAG: cation:proton antiporter [Pirellulaceae bacterium]|nr:cation:proton antiporter [Pirellulaceae bacterium]